MAVNMSSTNIHIFSRSNPVRRAILCSCAGILVLLCGVFAQQKPQGSVVGRVLDDSTSTPLSNVNVYVANTTLGGSTDSNGRFEIRNIPLGSYEIVASLLGYSVSSSRVVVKEAGTKAMEFRLKPTSLEVSEVLISAPDPSEWRKQLQRFKDLFLGTTPFSKECTLMNGENLDFAENEPISFAATARAPLIIENFALGYHIEFVLKVFKVVNDVMTVEGLPRYTEMKPSSVAESKHWRENRMHAYRGSLRHFLTCLFKKELTRSGFSAHELGSLQLDQQVMSRKIVTEDEILQDNSADYKTVAFRGYLEVEYAGEVDAGFNLLRKSGTIAQVSWLALNTYTITITERGLIDESFPTKTWGYWAWKRTADALPLDFEPDQE
jgi:hypothetical protein